MVWWAETSRQNHFRVIILDLFCSSLISFAENSHCANSSLGGSSAIVAAAVGTRLLWAVRAQSDPCDEHGGALCRLLTEMLRQRRAPKPKHWCGTQH